MPVRPLAMTAILAFALAVGAVAPVAGETLDLIGPPTPTVATVDTQAVVAPPMTDLGNARLAYQASWAQRQAGDFSGSIGTARRGLADIDAALAKDPDAIARLDLVDLRSRLYGLISAARRDSISASNAAAAGNAADERVLNAPATGEIQPQFNAQVYRYIDFFTGAGRSQFERWLKRSGRYMELFRDVLHKEGLPPDLVHLVFVESGFNINARSVSHAVGPWQLLRGTARMFGLNVNHWVDERKDPEKSSVAAARYLKHLYTVFGDWPLALASYNAGEGTVLRAIRTQGTTNYWDLKLPRQTEDYVPQFMAVLAIAHDPQKYGFDSVTLDDPMEFDQIAFHGAVDLRSIARQAGCSYDDLKALNPAVISGHAAGSDGVTTLRVPPGEGEALMQKLHGGAALPASNLTLQHRVHHGETIRSIAAQYSVSPRRLALANGIGRRNPLRVGTLLTVPASLSSPAPAILDDGDPRGSTAYVPPRAMKPLVQINGKSTADGRARWTVHRGQTLAMIADSNHVTVQDLKHWNGLTSNNLKRGQRLVIRRDSTDQTLSAADSAQVANLRLPSKHHHRRRHHTASADLPSTHTVRAGETLDSIANRHGVSVAELMRANGLSNSQVRAGRRLRIPTS